MTSRWLWKAHQLSRRIWVRASLFSVLAVVTALLGIVLSPYIPGDIPARIGADAVDNILGIIASSMLTVTTFSLSVMVSAYASATSNVTPRATRLVMEDATTQNALATFIGSFMFSLVGIIVLSTGAYGERGRVVLFASTLLVIVLIVGTLLRWIDHLSRLGRVTETTSLVEAAAIKAMRERQADPCLGGQPLEADADAWRLAVPVHDPRIGYVQHVDVAELAARVGETGGRLRLAAMPGDFVDASRPLAYLLGVPATEVGPALLGCFTIGDTRSFDQDPRFGVCVLAEIGSRALSPATNDLGTAIDIIGRAVRVLSVWGTPAPPVPVKYPQVFVPAIEPADLFDDMFIPLARDGAAVVEVGIRLQKALAMLSRCGDGRYLPHAARHAREALERAEAALVIEADRRRVRDAAAPLIARGGDA